MAETILTCPLGHTCEDARDGKIYRCRWLCSMGQTDANGQLIPGTEYDECAIPLQGLHLTELKKGTRGVQAAVESRMNNLIRLAESPELRNKRLEHGD